MNTLTKCIYAAAALFICSCSTPAIITSEWHRPENPAKNYNNVFIAALTATATDKQKIEDDVQLILEQKGLKAEKSIDLFPPKFTALGPVKQEVEIAKIKSTGADGILIIRLLRKEKEPHFVPFAVWDPAGDEYIEKYPDQFVNGYPYDFSYNGYYKDDMVYYVETKFYSIKSRKLVWAAASKTFDPNNMEGFVKGYMQTIYSRMVKDGLIASEIAKL